MYTRRGLTGFRENNGVAAGPTDKVREPLQPASAGIEGARVIEVCHYTGAKTPLATDGR